MTTDELEAEIERLTKGNDKLREQLKYACEVTREKYCGTCMNTIAARMGNKIDLENQNALAVFGYDFDEDMGIVDACKEARARYEKAEAERAALKSENEKLRDIMRRLVAWIHTESLTEEICSGNGRKHDP